ncbi:hypothetical protein LG047_11920 [Methylocystis sp. WRRC1]|uniref:hypothetical protein n=1 Tax=Methylocystis sp. WRRC1 TaxID=1732014 RepID=UPI001D149632|nr:hypothetical protein [Methylocystis sp. WRRC1]MCC3246032.1 hypothetical protein [Methylocystis sp. WRRC1]
MAKAQETGQIPVSQCHANAWGVYLSPGFEPGVRWGGHHVTIAGFNREQACRFGKGGMEMALEQTWRNLHQMRPFRFTNPADAQNIVVGVMLGKQPVTTFQSPLLNRLADQLYSRDFKQLHGPKYSVKKEPWHVSLYTKTIYVEWANIKLEPWRLFMVREPSWLCAHKGVDCHKKDWIEVNGQRGSRAEEPEEQPAPYSR